MGRSRSNFADLSEWGLRITDGRDSSGREVVVIPNPPEEPMPGGYRIIVRVDEEPIEFAEAEYLAPRRFCALWNGLPFRLTLELVYERGEFVCESLLAHRRPGGQAVSQSHLRKLQLSTLIEALVARAAFRQVVTSDGPRLRYAMFDRRGSDGWQDAYREVRKAHVPRRGKRLGDEHFQQVAEIYRDAHAQSQAPTLAVAKALSTSRSNAGRWVMEARRRGFLGEAPPGGRAGETLRFKDKRRSRKGGSTG